MTSLWNEDLVIKNKFSRPAYKLLSVEGVVIHWTANAGASDTAHKTYFDGTDGGGSRYAGAHLFVDSDSATLIIPLDEVAYHANESACKVSKLKATASYYQGGNANLNTIGIEMCVEKDGTIHKKTIERTAKIVAELCKKFNLDPSKDIYRHYDITGKNCPAPWVSKPSEFTAFKKTVSELVDATVKTSTSSTKATTTSTAKASTSTATTHKVVKGDTLSAIAKKYNTTVKELQTLNGLSSSTSIKVGDTLKVKATEVKAEAKTTTSTTTTTTKATVTTSTLASNIYGTVTVLVDSLNIRQSADFNSKVIKTAKKKDVLKVYSQKNGLYNVGTNLWVTSNATYVKFAKNPNYGAKEKKIKVLVSSLYTYKTANWNNKGAMVKKNEVFTVKRELTVDGAKMYELKSGLFITASTKYVELV